MGKLASCIFVGVCLAVFIVKAISLWISSERRKQKFVSAIAQQIREDEGDEPWGIN